MGVKIMSRPIIKIHDVSTDEVIEREMNDIEFAQYEIDQIVFTAARAEKEAKAQAKAALLAQLGITEEQAKLLLS
jgi:hypothetical protein